MNVQSLCAPWVALHENLGLGAPVRDEEHYAQLLEVAEAVAESVAADETSPLAGLLPLLADHIRQYEDRVHPWPDNSTPATVLASLMRAYGLRQSDLPEVGTQSVVSEVLSAKRELNLRQVAALAKRFSVPMEVFAA